MKLLHQPEEVIYQKYRIVDTLGQGGVGITYLAQDIENGKNLALKVLSLRRMTDWKKIELFERESQILSQLSHPAIPCYLDYFKIETDNDNSFYIAQQLAPGKSLAELVENGYSFHESEIRYIAIQVLDILIYLHSFSPPVIHRDIKPQNIIRGDNSKIFLVDFGAVADTYHNTVTGGSTVVGTFGYMAPEQFRGKAFPSTDLYGLGTTLLYLLTKKCPSDLPQKHLKIDFRSQIKVSPKFADWLDKILEPIVEDRFPDAGSALAVLQEKESLHNYLNQKPHRPKDTPISLRKNDEKLQIEIPAGKFRSNFRIISIMLCLPVNALLLLILTAGVQYKNNNEIQYSLLLLCFIAFSVWGYLIYSVFVLTKFNDFIISPLSRIQLTILKENNCYIFSCTKWLLPWRYQKFISKINQPRFKTTLHSIGCNLTPKEYRWIKTEINNFINNNIPNTDIEPQNIIRSDDNKVF
ncbi:serine/threonine protein kinase [Rivularia sp. PCC 7116]|uniref:serine/threonine protein kinase n=1 Tax=Rivularia sp. PCC 7116 TaxID=373994 RepID=UPI00029EE221|nr:serine/threonine-protein kinase [Rivularia sp. PCC 7116]AFY59014.1 serine/threonine protein kinase [Rivularia sp. PCC 7116]